MPTLDSFGIRTSSVIRTDMNLHPGLNLVSLDVTTPQVAVSSFYKRYLKVHTCYLFFLSLRPTGKEILKYSRSCLLLMKLLFYFILFYDVV